MVSEDDLTVASLAGLVGSELRTIDKYAEGRMSSNKLDPRSFLNKQHNSTGKPKNVVYQDGKAFYAGIDEEYVRSQCPDPAPSVPVTAVAAAIPTNIADQQFSSSPKPQPQVETFRSEETELLSASLIKILKSIDKSLKQIATKLTSTSA